VSIGKVILVVLATLVIFSTGLITGIVLMKQMPKATPVAPNPLPLPGPGMQQFLRRIQGELELTPEQQERITGILRDSQDRTRGLARTEFGKVRDQIRVELKPAQREKFERLLKQRQRRAEEKRFNLLTSNF
jgi:hypothetical protein